MMNASSGQAHVVKKSKFTEEQIAFALRKAELGPRVEDVSLSQDGHQRRDVLCVEEVLLRRRSFRTAQNRHGI